MKRFFASLFCVATIPYAFAAYPVDVTATQVSDLAVNFKAFNTIVAERSITVSSEVSGLIEQKTPRAALGARVPAGAVLFRIDALPYQAALAGARSQLAQAELDVRVEQGRQHAATEQLRFITSTMATGTTTTLDRELILRTPYLDAARALLAQAQKDYQRAKQQVEKTTVRAPCDGFIQSTEAAKGEYINTGAPLAQVVCDGSYIVVATVPMQQYRWLHNDLLADMRVTLVRQLGSVQYTVPAQLVRVIPALEATTRMVQVYVRVENNRQADYPLLLDEFVTVEFALATQRQVVRLPLDALRGIDTVWVADANGQLVIETVDVLYQDKRFIYLPLEFGINKQVVTSSIANPVAGMALQLHQPQ